MKIEVVVFESYLQRPKDVVFEGLSSEGLVMVVVEKGRRRRRREGRERLENLRVRERIEVKK